MKTIYSLIAAAAATFLLSCPAHAQSDMAETVLPVTIAAPADWKPQNDAIGEGLLAAFVDPKTENRIELLSKQIIREEHAAALFEAFSNQLVSSGFIVTAQGTEKSFDLTDGTIRKGTWTEYTYITSDIPISIVTFIFTAQSHAIIVVGYFSRAERERGIETLQTLIQNMADSPKPN